MSSAISRLKTIPSKLMAGPSREALKELPLTNCGTPGASLKKMLAEVLDIQQPAIAKMETKSGYVYLDYP
jgi:hypothetical protein